MTYPHDTQRAPESALATYLTTAQELLAATLPSPLLADFAATPLSADFEVLRWFELPAICLT